MADWKKDLHDFFEEKSRKTPREEALEERQAEADRFLARAVLPAFEEIKKELERHNRAVRIASARGKASLRVKHNGLEEYRCDILVRIGPQAAVPYAVRSFIDRKTKTRRNSEVNLREGSPIYTVADFLKIHVILFVVNDYKSHVV